MTFFYDLNKRLAGIANKPESKQLNERDMSRAAKGYEKYGKEGMEALAKAGREGKNLDPIRDKYNKYDKSVDEGSTGDYSAKKARAGKDIGRPGKQFAKIARGAAERYGSKERGEKVAGAVLAKLRKGVGEAAKPDYIDLDKDGNRTEPMRQAARQAKKGPVDEVKLADLPVRQVKGRAYGAQPEEPELDDEEAVDTTPKKAGRPKGTGRKLGAKGPTGQSKLMKKGAIREDDVEVQDQGEYGMEGDHAKDDIHTLVRDARALEKILGDSDDLPEWVQAKLTKAKGMISAVSDYMQTERERAGEQGPEMELDEKAVSVAQRRAAGIAHAAQKGDIPKSELRGASKAMAKMPAKELKKFAKTKERGLPEKKGKEEVEETTTSGSVATAPAEAPKKSKGGMQFGKGIYDSMNRDLEAMISESMSINISSSTDGSPSVSVTATDEDAMKLSQILKAAGIGSSLGGEDQSCPSCGGSPCGCAEKVDENKPDWPTNTEISDDALQYSGGLNKPKTDVAGDGQTTVPVTAVRVQEGDQEMAESTCNMTAEGEMCPKHGMAECGMYEDEHSRILELAGIQEAKPDFLDLDRDGNKKESMKQAANDKKAVKESGTGDAPISKMSDKDLADYCDMSVEEVKRDRERAEEVARDKTDDLKENQAFESSLVDMSRLWKAYKAQ